MKARIVRIMIVVALTIATLPVGGAGANHTPIPFRTLPDITVTPDSGIVTWEGTQATGANANYSFTTGEPCFPANDPTADLPLRQVCDIMLLRVNLSGHTGFWDTRGGGVQVRLDNYTAVAQSDFDMQIFRSDAQGRRFQLVGSSGNPPGLPEAFTIANADGYYLIQVVYFAVVNSKYTGEIRFILRNKFAPDVDEPPGLQEFPASVPSLGFRSYSEPHIAQSPLDPNVLVAGSKFYNRDLDSLAEYEFKIGSFVSFDGGMTWTTLGQIDVCPPDQTGPPFPNNTCYPEEDPNANNEPAEEYITSDVWLQFDDEGNAYVMVLDAGTGQPGWGMTLHKWESVSPNDLITGQTWSHRIPINAYETNVERQRLLDDKNTLAVNNAGPDGDGQTGIMVACWGLNAPNKQEIVCEPSLDGGRTWPLEPIPVSNVAEALVIGVHVMADPNDPLRFYTVWLQYTGSLVGGPSTMQFSQTFDGGLTWTPDIPIAILQGIPRQFPGQSFRNLSIPITGIGPAGELYVVYADYRDAPDPGNDPDRKQADIMLVRSTTGGVLWDAPVKVNQETSNADQFQPYVTVNPNGQVDVVYFDRRHDPDNFFIDTYLSTSTDMGQTFSDTRLSHDMWDPSLNPPVSPSGDFIGDYQALVADECFTIPFVNDTHLANDPSRDPDFDGGLPRSKFQEVFAWRIPTGDCPVQTLVKATGGGQVPGSTSNGRATFGLNARRTTTGVLGDINVFDHGTGQQIESVNIASVMQSGNEITIQGTCSVNGGPALPCEVRASDRATPGGGQDEFRIAVGPGGSAYLAGGVLERGNIKIHQ